MILWHEAVWAVSECEVSVVTMGLWPLPGVTSLLTPHSSLSPLSPLSPHWLTLRSPLRDLAMWWQWQLGSGQARARDPGHWIATPLPRPAPHMIPGLRRATRPPPHYKYYFNVKHKVEFSSHTLPQLTFVALQSQFNVFFMIKDSSFKFLSLIMVDRILPRGQIRLRMYRRTFN